MNRRPVICQVLHSLHVGGAEVLAAGIARALADRFRFVFACLDGLGSLGEQLRSDGFTVEVFGRQPGIDWRCGLKLAAFCRTQQVELLHAHQYTPFFQSLLARVAYRCPPIIFTEHGRHYPDRRSAKHVVVNRTLTRGDDRFIAVGESVRRALISNEGLPRRRVDVIYNGVQVGSFAAVRGNTVLRDQVRHELGLTADQFAIFHIARLNRLKDHETALRSIDLLRHRHPRFRLVIAGDGEERARLEQIVLDRKLEHHVRFLGTRPDIPRLLAAADASLLTSISEGIPLTLIEAMLAGVPVVSTDVGGIPEVIRHEDTGLLTASGDSSALASSLERVAHDHPLQERLVSAAADRAARMFSLDRMHAQYADVYSTGTGLYGNQKPSARPAMQVDRYSGSRESAATAQS